MKRILVGFIEDGKHSGIDKYLLGFLKTALETGVSPDFLTSVYDADMAAFLKERGCRLFAVPSLKHPLGQYRAVRKILQNEDFDALYLNISEPLNCAAAFAGKKEGVPVILHSHASGVDRANPIERKIRTCISALCRPALSRQAERYLACSDLAAKWLYPKKITDGKNFRVIYNAVSFDRFCFSEEKRRCVRTELALENRFVLLFVGHFCYQKNNLFLLDIAKEIFHHDGDAVLLCAGVGDDLEKCRAKANALGIEKNVRFLGVRQDIDALFSAADVFVLPSRFEGLPLVAVEAQASGVPVFLSDRITTSAKISDRAEFCPLSESPAFWAKRILSVRDCERRAAEISPDFAQKFDLKNQRQQLIDEVLL